MTSTHRPHLLLFALSLLLPVAFGTYSTTESLLQNITSVSPNSSQDSTVTVGISPSSTEDSSTPTATTHLPVPTVLDQTTGLATTSSPSTSQPQSTLFPISTSALTTHGDQTTIESTSPSIPAIKTTVDSSGPDQDTQTGLSYSETAMTIFFGVVLGIAVLIVAAYSIGRCNRKRTQYTHQPLHNSPEDRGQPGFSVDRFGGLDDTLVISGGLYDGPQVFNPASTGDEVMSFHSDRPPFASGASQFRLEFLPDEQDKPPTFQSFQALDEQS